MARIRLHGSQMSIRRLTDTACQIRRSPTLLMLLLSCCSSITTLTALDTADPCLSVCVQYKDFLSNSSFAKYTKQWIDCHLVIAETLGKPLIMGEFGDQNNTESRAMLFDQVSVTSHVYVLRG